MWDSQRKLGAETNDNNLVPRSSILISAPHKRLACCDFPSLASHDIEYEDNSYCFDDHPKRITQAILEDYDAELFAQCPRADMG